MRFTLCKLFLGVTMAALASAGMTLHTRLWAEAIVSFSIVLYAAVAILAFRRGCEYRAFRIAFATVGAAYLLIALCSLFSPIRDLLITNRVLVAAAKVQPVTPTYAPPGLATSYVTTTPYMYSGPINLALQNIPGLEAPDNQFGSPLLTPSVPPGAFLIIGHCVWSWLLALAAGCFAAFVNRPRALASQ